MNRSRHLYTIELKNGKVYKVKTTMQLNNDRSYLKFKQNGGHIYVYPKDTKQISITDHKGRELIGLPGLSDTSWLFQVTKGRLNTYSVIPVWNTIFITAIQKDSTQAPVQIDQRTILKMVADNPKALKLAKKRKLMSAIMTYDKN